MKVALDGDSAAVTVAFNYTGKDGDPPMFPGVRMFTYKITAGKGPARKDQERPAATQTSGPVVAANRRRRARMRHLVTFGAVVAILTCCGCNAKTEKAVIQEVARYTYVEDLGPLVVASIVGASAPPGGLGGLNGICMDRAWRTWVGKQDPAFELAPSMFEVPDPNRPIRIGSAQPSEGQ
jgi:hypothetical protein